MPDDTRFAHTHIIADTAGLPAALETFTAQNATLQAMISTLGQRVTALEASKPVPAEPKPTEPKPDEQQPKTARVTSLADFRAALQDGEPHITVAFLDETVSTPIRIPRIAQRTILAEEGAFIGGNGQDFHILKVDDGTGGRLALQGPGVIDGGWRKRPGECTGDQAAQLFAPNMDELLIEDWTTQYSRRTGFFATGCKTLIMRRVKGFAMPRDFIWSNDSLSVLVEDCVVQHCGDDGIGTHLSPGRNMRRDVIIRRNRLRDCNGIKVLGDGAILIEDNVIEACAFYGVRLGKDYTTGEGDVDLHDITVRRNVITDLQQSSPCHPGQRYGAPLMLDADQRRCENVVFEGNAVHLANPAGTLLRSVYPWAIMGRFSKQGFQADAKMDPATLPRIINCSNPGDVVIR